MKTCAMALLAVTFPMLPISVTACDCGCGGQPPPIHFIDGIPSNGPVTGDPGSADPARYSAFGFRDYGPAHVAPPAPAPPQPSS